MLHVTCDCCGKELESGKDQHYVMKIEAYAAHDPREITEDDLDEDNLETISQLLQDLAAHPESYELEPQHRQFRYDLCPDCHQKITTDPLGRFQPQQFKFSTN